jgi:hypothetical protein
LARTHLPDGRLSEDIDLIAIDDRKAVAEVLDAQLLSARGRELWPTERRALQQRYHDAPAAELLVPTLPAFAASKTATWADRRAPRDLWDLWALHQDWGHRSRRSAAVPAIRSNQSTSWPLPVRSAAVRGRMAVATRRPNAAHRRRRRCPRDRSKSLGSCRRLIVDTLLPGRCPRNPDVRRWSGRSNCTGAPATKHPVIQHVSTRLKLSGHYPSPLDPSRSFPKLLQHI